MIEDRLSSLLAEWIDSNRPDEFPDSAIMPVHVARRDEIRTRPCIVLNTSESKPVPPMQYTARVKLDVHLFSQVDDTPADNHKNERRRIPLRRRHAGDQFASVRTTFPASVY